MRRTLSRVLAIATATVTAGCSYSPVGPAILTEFEDRFLPGYTLTVLSTDPPSSSTIDRRHNSGLLRVEVEYEAPTETPRNRLWVCLGRDGGTFLYSSCRDSLLGQSKGRTTGHAGISYINSAPAFPETRFILIFLAPPDEPLLVRRGAYEDELGFDRLSPGILASRRVEHLLLWR
jgi:hypothetical protein